MALRKQQKLQVQDSMRLQQTARKTPPHLQTHKTGNISSLAARPSKAQTVGDKAQPGRRQGLDQEKFQPEGFFLFATPARRLLFFANIIQPGGFSLPFNPKASA